MTAPNYFLRSMTYIFLFCVYFWLSLSNWILQSFDHVFSHPFWRKWIKMSWTKLMVVFVGGKVTESYYHTWHASREFRRDKHPEIDLKLGEQCKRVNVLTYFIALPCCPPRWADTQTDCLRIGQITASGRGAWMGCRDAFLDSWSSNDFHRPNDRSRR